MADAATASAEAGQPKYVLSVDIGSTTMRCFVVDADVKFVSVAVRHIEYLRPHQGYVELDPDVIWEQFVAVVKEAMENAKITAAQVSSLGISLARGTFTSWHRETGELLHPFISWQDTRAADLAKSWNRSASFRTLAAGSRALHMVTRAKRWLAVAVIEFRSFHMCIRAQWVLQNIPRAKELADEGNLLFGTMDTFLLWRLSAGKVHATDSSNASATALYDTFVLDWSSASCHLMGVPMNSLPKVMDTSGLICASEEGIFGGAIEVHSVVADQQAAAFGQMCCEARQVKCTLGTGSFVDIITTTPHASSAGIYPVVGWRIGDEVAYMAEGVATSTGSCVEWAKQVGWFDDVADTSRMAESVEDSNGVCFIPAFSGLEAPIKDPNACCSLFGLTPDTRREHLVRAMLESFAFRVSQVIDTAEQELGYTLDPIRVDGGVSRNDFVLQAIADLTGATVQRADNLETAALGAAFFAGLSSGFWKSRDLLKEKVTFTDTFVPKPENKARLIAARCLWERAVERSRGWYKKAEHKLLLASSSKTSLG